MLALVLAFTLAGGQADAGATALVDAAQAVPGLRLDIRYATSHNVTGRAVYASARCLLLPEVAQALARVQAALAKRGLGLLAWDCYRPLSVQRELWRAYPHAGFVADPNHGSNHNRGAAIDVTLVDENGRPLPMPTDFDSFDERAHVGATEGVSAAAHHNRATLEAAMLAEGFHTIRREWWHFNAPGAATHPLLDTPL
jgi:D-alanyl-D-alanine dipeptidase